MTEDRYEKGMAKRFAPKVDENCEVWGRWDACTKCGKYHDNELTGEAVLPHQCNEWNIGGTEQIKMLIADLEQMLVNEVKQ